jgi:hypothetical protein
MVNPAGALRQRGRDASAGRFESSQQHIRQQRC